MPAVEVCGIWFRRRSLHYGRDDRKCLVAFGWTNSVLLRYRSFTAFRMTRQRLRARLRNGSPFGVILSERSESKDLPRNRFPDETSLGWHPTRLPAVERYGSLFRRRSLHYGRDDRKCLAAFGWTNSVLSRYRSRTNSMNPPEEWKTVWVSFRPNEVSGGISFVSDPSTCSGLPPVLR